MKLDAFKPSLAFQETLSLELRRYQLHLAKQQISPGSINAAIAALRFFFTVTLERPDLVRPLTTVNKPRKRRSC